VPMRGPCGSVEGMAEPKSMRRTCARRALRAVRGGASTGGICCVVRAGAEIGSGRPLSVGWGDLGGAVFECEEDVVRLDVGVDDALAVDVLEHWLISDGYIL
jgi:hypothetical protein